MRRQAGKDRSRGLVAVFFALTACAPFLCRADDSLPKPKVKIDEPVFDFGTVSQGTKISHDFVIRNLGNADLNIHRIVPACGCTAATVGKDLIEPGKSDAIKVELDTSDFSGEKVKLVRVFTSDMDDPSTTLTLKGTIESDLKLEPARISFNAVTRGPALASEKRQVHVSVKPTAGLEISDVKSFSKLIKVKVLTNTKHDATFEVSLDPTAPVGELRDRLVVNLKGAKEMSVNVPVFAQIDGPLKISPGTVSFGIVEGTEPIVRSVKLDNAAGQPIQIQKVESSDPAVSSTVTAVKEGSNYVIHVQVDPTKVRQDLRAVVTITTDSKTELPLALNVFGILPPKSSS